MCESKAWVADSSNEGSWQFWCTYFNYSQHYSNCLIISIGSSLFSHFSSSDLSDVWPVICNVVVLKNNEACCCVRIVSYFCEIFQDCIFFLWVKGTSMPSGLCPQGLPQSSIIPLTWIIFSFKIKRFALVYNLLSLHRSSICFCCFSIFLISET